METRNVYDKEYDDDLEYFKSEIDLTKSTSFDKAKEKFALAAMGSIPWFGGFIAAAASLHTDKKDNRRESLQNMWLEEHAKKIHKLKNTIDEIFEQFDRLGEDIKERVESDEYLDIVRKGFKAWDDADSDEKRKYIGNLIANATGINICSDDVLRLFIDWLKSYHEAHFAVIRVIYKRPQSTRYDIWMEIYKEEVLDSSAEADLFKFLIRELSTGGVIRQFRETNESGQFYKKQIPRTKNRTNIMKTPFDSKEEYELTELGKQFVHYTMNEIVPRIK